MCVSVIIPALNEGDTVVATLRSLEPVRARGGEIIVVDGASDDDTVEQARPRADRVLEGPRGRARQMNAGAAVARGDVLWFVHADTVVDAAAADELTQALARGTREWGRFGVRLSGRQPLLRVVERLMNLRSRVTGIATGDQGLFVRRAVFEAIGGFPDQPLMEDVALSRLLRARGRPACLPARLVTSGRRWETNGVWRTIVLMWALRWAYWRGADAAELARRYRGRPG